jgi:uncharacterized membrane protein YwaF
MQNFFYPAEHHEIIIPMYGTIHKITLLAIPVFIALIIWKKDTVKKIVANRRFMVSLVIGFYFIEMWYWIFMWSFHVEPMYERFPLHLCATMSLLMPLFILLQRYSWFRFFSFWAVCSGFISIVNLSFVGVGIILLHIVFFSFTLTRRRSWFEEEEIVNVEL